MGLLVVVARACTPPRDRDLDLGLRSLPAGLDLQRELAVREHADLVVAQ
jgi:hypothetical protein